MRMRSRSLAACVRTATLIAAFASSITAEGHAFAAPYTLPVPFWLYAYGSAVALLISFVFFALFSAVNTSSRFSENRSGSRRFRVRSWSLYRLIAWIAQVVTALILLFTIVCGLIGTPNALLNFNMTWFWMIFMLLSMYAACLIGDFYQMVNPWNAAIRLAGRTGLVSFKGILRYPRRLGYFPALLAYFGLIALELFGNASPEKLSVCLLAYSCLLFVGAWLFGRETWIRHADVFGVVFSLVSLLAPIEWVAADGSWRIKLRLPFSGFSTVESPSFSMTCFIVFMLSSTAFDGIHDTILWNTAYWAKLFPIIKPVIENYSNDLYGNAAKVYYLWQWLCLALSPTLYLAAYAAVLVAGKWLVRSQRALNELILDFSWSLVPIAFFYNVTHYFTVAISQSPQIVRLASDPFGKRWDIFGTASTSIPPLILDAGFVWHAQVALILMGHILSVYLAHSQSFQSFGSRSRAILSQVPMVVLMVLFTASGLWILSLPMAAA